MPEFTVVPSKRFEDDFRGLPKDIQRLVLAAINRIKANPQRGQKLRGVSIGEWRYRVGDCHHSPACAVVGGMELRGEHPRE